MCEAQDDDAACLREGQAWIEDPLPVALQPVHICMVTLLQPALEAVTLRRGAGRRDPKQVKTDRAGVLFNLISAIHGSKIPAMRAGAPEEEP